MRCRPADAATRRVDAALSICDLFRGQGFAFDCVIASLNGEHARVLNRKSDRAYFVLDGSGVVSVGNTVYDVGPEDFVSIKAGTPHSIRGKLRYLVVTAPPFDPANELKLE